MKTSAIVCHFGYVEESYASFMAFLNRAEDGPFPDAVQAVQNLAHCFLIKYVEDYGSDVRPRECCVEFRKREQEGDRVCPKCTRRLEVRGINLEHFATFISSHIGQTMDGYGDALMEIGPWTEFVSVADLLEVPREEIIEISENAEVAIPFALDGTEFDDEDHVCHDLAAELHKGVEEYWKEHPWVHRAPRSREDLEQFYEQYRIKQEAP